MNFLFFLFFKVYQFESNSSFIIINQVQDAKKKFMKPQFRDISLYFGAQILCRRCLFQSLIPQLKCGDVMCIIQNNIFFPKLLNFLSRTQLQSDTLNIVHVLSIIDNQYIFQVLATQVNVQLILCYYLLSTPNSPSCQLH